MDQGSETLGIELIGLVDVAHEYLGLRGMGQLWDTASLFNLVDDPVVVADCFECDRSPFWEVGKEFLDGVVLVVDAHLFNG